MKNLILVLILIFSTTLFTECYNRIDAGHDGVLIEQYGTKKGV